VVNTELDIATLAAAASETRRGETGWDEDAWVGALIATQHADPPWPAVRVWLAVAHEIGDEQGHPRHLIEAARAPLGPGSAPGDIPAAVAPMLDEVRARAAEATAALKSERAS
jgi:hypothetical protein